MEVTEVTTKTIHTPQVVKGADSLITVMDQEACQDIRNGVSHDIESSCSSGGENGKQTTYTMENIGSAHDISGGDNRSQNYICNGVSLEIESARSV